MRLRRTCARAGFTLLELMVALTVGGIAITSIYAIGAASTRVFRVQNDVSNAQTALRMAMDQVKRDVARAGYLGTPNASLIDPDTSLNAQLCGSPPAFDAPNGSGRLAAFSAFKPGNGTSAVDSTGNNAANGFTADEIVLFGNYSTSDEYPILRGDLNAATDVVFQHGFYEFQRDFTDWSTGTNAFNLAAFTDAFMTGRAVRIHLPSRKYIFNTVAGAPVGNNPVSLPLSIGMNQACLTELNGATISPLNAIRYYVRAPNPGDESPRFGGAMAQLIRSEVQPDGKVTPLTIPGTNPPAALERSVLDHVVAFRLAFTMSGTNLRTGQPDAYVIGQTTTAAGLETGTVNGNPELVRAVTIDLAVRTSDQDEGFAKTTPASLTYPVSPLCANLGCFQVVKDKPGAARVRSLRAEVFVPNVAMEGW